MNSEKIINIYKNLYIAYDMMNEKFFENKLPICLLTINPSKTSKGHFRPQYFFHKEEINAEEKEFIDEINLNPDLFLGRGEKLTYSTLLHEMVHLWQEHFGKFKSKNNYHSKEWADKMEEVGLQASHTGRIGGKRTGNSMTHYVIEDGVYDQFYEKNKDLLNIDLYVDKKYIQGEKIQRRQNIRYECPSCNSKFVTKQKNIVVYCNKCNCNYEKK